MAMTNEEVRAYWAAIDIVCGQCAGKEEDCNYCPVREVSDYTYARYGWGNEED